MKTLILVSLVAISNLLSFFSFAQCDPLIIIDGNYIVADENNPKGVKLPFWLSENQTLAKGQYVYSISVIEFTVNGTALDYSQNKKVTTVETVPAGKTWKIESIFKDMVMPVSSNGVSYTDAGTYTFTSPPCISVATIQVWGAGGGGSSGTTGGGYGGNGGGGGGYCEGVYQLPASTSYSITVGAAGVSSNTGSAGGNSSLIGGVLNLTATGGGGGPAASGGSVGGTAGSGSGGQLNIAGQAGIGRSGANGGKGGSSAFGGGGIGGISSNPGESGSGLGSGGGGGSYYFTDSDQQTIGGSGGGGKVSISFGNGSSPSATTSSAPCQVMYLRSRPGFGEPALCPTDWSQVDYKTEWAGSGTTYNYLRTCMKCE